MRAIMQDEYGPAGVLRLQHIDRPAVGDDQVLVRVRASSVNIGDLFMMTGTPYILRLAFGLRRPRIRIRGLDIAGVVEAVGRDVTRLQPGDEVYGLGDGALAEYVCVHADRLARKPAGLTFEQAAAAPNAGLTALHGVQRSGQVQPGHRVLVNGASGGVGTFTVQMARAFGAEVTGVCSPRNVDLVRSLGAVRVIDYTRDDFTRDGQRYDLVVDNAGNHSFADLRRVVRPGGVLISQNGTVGGRWFGPLVRMAREHLASVFAPLTVRGNAWSPNASDLATLAGYLESGEVAPVIDRTFTLDETAKAFTYVGEGHARGKVVVTV